MILQIFSQVNNNASAIYRKISLNIAVDWVHNINNDSETIIFLTDQVVTIIVMIFTHGVHLLDDTLLYLLQ